MSDLYHVYGGDLSLSEDGTLAVASGQDVSAQRVLRRLATNVKDYIFALEYGAGLPGRIGTTETPADLQAIILQQMTLEPSVASTPTPVVQVTDMGGGLRKISVTYASSETGDTVSLEL